jgi:hypothetical protein
MLIDSAQHGATPPAVPPPGLLARAAGQVRQFLCGLHGHDALLHFEETRISLQCTSCGYQTPGWELKTTAADARTAAPTSRAMRLPLVRESRVA